MHYFLYYCPGCKQFELAEQDNMELQCDECGRMFVSLHLLEEEWDGMSSEKRRLKLAQTANTSRTASILKQQENRKAIGERVANVGGANRYVGESSGCKVAFVAIGIIVGVALTLMISGIFISGLFRDKINEYLKEWVEKEMEDGFDDFSDDYEFDDSDDSDYDSYYDDTDDYDSDDEYDDTGDYYYDDSYDDTDDSGYVDYYDDNEYEDYDDDEDISTSTRSRSPSLRVYTDDDEYEEDEDDDYYEEEEEEEYDAEEEDELYYEDDDSELDVDLEDI